MRKQEFGQNRNRGEWEDLPTPIVCNAQSYARFSRWLEGELAKLERRWRHLSAPAARQRLSRGAFRITDTSQMPKPKPK